MSDPCGFCDEIIPDSRLLAYDAAGMVAFVPVEHRATNRGHMLVAPRRHVRDLHELPPRLAEGLIEALRTVSVAVRDTCGADGTTLVQNNGPPGQDVFHLHFHVIPRHARPDDMTGGWERLDLEQQQAAADRIRHAIADGRASSSATRRTPPTPRGAGFEIRAGRGDDAATIAELIGVMGYDVSADLVTRKLMELGSDHAVLVAETQGTVAGWTHVHVDHTLYGPAIAQLGGLSVAERWTAHGIGTALMEAAEDWAQHAGCHALWIRSGEQRTAAHEFYRRLGYRELKRQAVFFKTLDDATSDPRIRGGPEPCPADPVP